MNPSSENNAHFESKNARSFLHGQPSSQQPYPGFWYLSPVCTPFYVPGTGFRTGNGNPYFPYYSLALSENPGFFVPQSPVPSRVNQRPPFPVYHHAAPFWQCNGLGKTMKTKETQTDLQEAENKISKWDRRLEADCHDIKAVARVATITIATETDAAPENTNGGLSSITQERELCLQSLWDTASYRNMPPGSTAFEKEEVRRDYSSGSPAAHFSEMAQEATPLCELACGEAKPENKGQRSLMSRSPGAAVASVPRDAPGGEDIDRYRAAMQSGQPAQGARDKESRSGMEMSLDKGKTGYGAVPRVLSPPPDKIEVIGEGQAIENQNSPTSEVCQSTKDVNDGRSLCSSKKPVNELSLQSSGQISFSDSERALDITFVSTDTAPFPSPSFLARFKHVDEAISCVTSGFSWNNYTASSEKMSTQERLFKEELETVYSEIKLTECLQDHPEDKLKKARKSSIQKEKTRKPEALTSSLKRRTTYTLKRDAVLDSLFSEDSGDREKDERSEEGDTEKYEVECLFQEVCPQGHLNSSKGRLYQEVGRRILCKPPESPFSPQLIFWAPRNNLKLKLGAYGSIPLVYKVKEQEDWETTYGRCQKKHRRAKQESKRASYKSSESESGKSNRKVCTCRPVNKSEISG